MCILSSFTGLKLPFNDLINHLFCTVLHKGLIFEEILKSEQEVVNCHEGH